MHQLSLIIIGLYKSILALICYIKIQIKSNNLCYDKITLNNFNIRTDKGTSIV